MNTKLFAILALGAAQCMAVADAEAATRRLTVNATGACQSALPVFDVQIRKRPLAVQNEGTAPAFITCSYYSIGPYGFLGVNGADIFAATNNGTASSLTCTGVNGYNAGDARYVLKTVDLPADGSRVVMSWAPNDFSDDQATFPYATFNISCNLNPGVGINDGNIYYDDGLPE